jgi:hypothetical protein
MRLPGQSGLKLHFAPPIRRSGEFLSEGVRMGISPVAGVRGLSLLKPSKNESFVPPALAVEASGRAGDDTYDDSGETHGRGLKEEASDVDSEPEAGAGEGTASAPVDPDLRVNLFA